MSHEGHLYSAFPTLEIIWDDLEGANRGLRVDGTFPKLGGLNGPPSKRSKRHLGVCALEPVKPLYLPTGCELAPMLSPSGKLNVYIVVVF